MNFNELALIPELLKALEDEGYVTPSTIQEQAIPPLLEGRDLLGCAQTGTGKTAAFALPILQYLQQHPLSSKGKKPIRALILTPTRELAIQINESFKAYGKYLNLKSCVIFGGVSQGPQVSELARGVDVLIATPGRLNDLIQQGYIELGKVEKFVLDEADRMLDMGFINDVKKIQAKTPPNKQTLLFSATMPAEIIDFVNRILIDPVKITVAPVSSTVDNIKQSVYFVDRGNKLPLMINILKDEDIISLLVFTRTKHGADRVVRELNKNRITALAIHGNKSQNARQTALESFKSGEVRVLVATDIAARGIDIDKLSHVINYELPNIPETYVHRIGRTGRAGLSGVAISFCDFDEKEYLDDIEKLIKKTLDKVEDNPFPMVIFEKTVKVPQTRRPRSERGSSVQGKSFANNNGERRGAPTKPQEDKKTGAKPKAYGKPYGNRVAKNASRANAKFNTAKKSHSDR